MKIVAAGFTTALLVFAVATAMSEMLSAPDAAPSNATATRRRAKNVKPDDESARSTLAPSSSQRADTSSQDNAAQLTAELQRRLDAVRQRESAAQAKQDALRIILDEIREEQRTVDLLRRRFSEEIATRRATAVRPAQTEESIPNDVSQASFVSRPAERTRPALSVRNAQEARDAAVLIKRLVDQGNRRSAIALLLPLNDRDATKVLTALSATDSEMAVQLTQDLLAAREENSNRR